jgi:hypothetical protein
VLGVTVIIAAQAAGMARDTWHRMEKGEVAVTIGAWFNALAVLGLEFGVGIAGEPAPARAADAIPVAVRLADYPQLAALYLTPEEAGLMDGLKRVFGDNGNI